MPDRSRIPGKAQSFAAFMMILDNLQLSDGDIPGTLKWEQWKWTQEESQQVTLFRTQAELYYSDISKGDLCPPVVKKKMSTLIKTVRAYDNGKLDGHHLLDKIGLYGSVNDCKSANVKQGTSLAELAYLHVTEDIMLMPTVALQELGLGFHKLRVYCADNNKKRQLPKGMAFALICRYIGTEPPQGNKGFELIGAAKNGYFRSIINRDQLDPKLKYFAWYYALYLTKKGKLLSPSGLLQVQIVN